MKSFLTCLMAVSFSATVPAGPMSLTDRVAADMEGQHRSDANKARNVYRHPVETLEFFGIADGMSVMEIWPGGGWYTEILAPVMRGHGKLVIATWDPEVEGQAEYRYRLPKEMNQKFTSQAEIYDQVETVFFSPPQSASLGDDSSVDAVVTFRNTHGWIRSGQAQLIFNEFARVLKPGGVLGVVQHRADEGTDLMESAKQGYVSESAVKALAANAGLVFEAASDVNANPMDRKDYPEGVWTLPPSYDLEDQDREIYTAIGESDRMTLRFRKP